VERHRLAGRGQGTGRFSPSTTRRCPTVW
jgi:hypothetical protein